MTTSLATLSPPAIVDTTTLGVPSLFFENVNVPVWPSSYIRFHTPTRSLKLSGACATADAAVRASAAESSHRIAGFIGTSFPNSRTVHHCATECTCQRREYSGRGRAGDPFWRLFDRGGGVGHDSRGAAAFARCCPRAGTPV